MKKLLIMVLLVSMILALAINASAASVISLDSMINGKVESGSAKGDVAINIIAAGTMIDRFKIGAEYGIGTTKIVTSNDLSLWSVKGGYRLIDAKASKLDGIIALLNINSKNSHELNSTMVGVDFTQYLSEKAFLSATYATAISGSFKPALGPEDTSAPTTLLRLKFNYLVAENIGLAAGYNDLKYSYKSSLNIALSGFNVGLLYKF